MIAMNPSIVANMPNMMLSLRLLTSSEDACWMQSIVGVEVVKAVMRVVAWGKSVDVMFDMFDTLEMSSRCHSYWVIRIYEGLAQGYKRNARDESGLA